MGQFDGITDIDDERIKGYSLAAREMIVADELKKQQQQTTAEASTQQWQTYIEERIRSFVEDYVEDAIGIVGEEVHLALKKLHDELRKDIEALDRRMWKRAGETEKQKITIVAPQLDLNEALAPLREELKNLRNEITNKRSAEVLDLPALPRRRA